MPHPSRARILFAFLAVYLVWGSTYLAIRLALETMPAFFLAGTRFVIAGLLLFAWLGWRATRGGDPVRMTAAHWRSAFIVGSLLFVCGNGAVVWAQRTVPSGLAALMIGGAPLWFALLGWLVFRERRPSFGAFAGILIGLSGIALLFLPGALGANVAVDRFGAATIVVGSMGWVTGSLLMRRLELPKAPFVATAMEMTAGGLGLLVLSAATGEWSRVDPESWTTRSLLAWTYLVLFGSVLATTAYVWLLGVVSSVRVATYAYVNPVVAVLLGCLVLREPFTARVALATAIIIGGVAMVLVSQSRATAGQVSRNELGS